MRHAFPILVAALLASAIPSLAQPGGWEFDVGLSSGFLDRSYIWGAGLKPKANSVESRNSRTVRHSNPVFLPTFSLRGGYRFPGTYMGLFFNVFGNYAWNDLYGGPSLLQEKEIILHAVPEIRFYYNDDPDFRLYGSLGAGVRYRQFAETFEGDTIPEHDFQLSYFVSPFGFSRGEKWTFSFEVGIGAPWSILKIGAGYRF